MIYLHTFGHLDLRDAQGEQISSVLLHPKRIGLLVYLAAARPKGFHRRDKLLALFWPELDDEHARASLRKAIHYLRRSLGEHAIVSHNDDELGLDGNFVHSDVAQLHDAFERNDAQAALDLYQGPLLDGFFLEAAAGFEDWLELERAHLHRLAFRAACERAESAQQAQDSFGAAHWARRAAALAPDDEAALRHLMALLDQLGDRAGALAAYDDFARRLHRDYESEPALETQQLVQSIRARGGDTQVSVDAHADVVTMPTRFSRRRAAIAISTVAVLVVAAASSVRWLPSRTSEAASARVIAVMPFSFRGQPELAYLREGMVNLLSTNLDHIGEFRSADPNAVLASQELSNGNALTSAGAGQVALRIGAGMFVNGDIVEVNGRLRVSAALYDARRPARPIARANAEGDATALFTLIDEVTSQLIAGERRAPAERFTRLALLTTHSVPALKAYLTGEQQFRAGRYNEAVESFQRAVQADTTFALGYYRLALAHMWGSNDADRVAAERAITFGRRLAGPDRALLEALLPFFRGDADEAERQYRAILVTRPEESEVWYPLGEVLFHHNSMRGRRTSEAREPFERALALGPKDGPLTHLVEVAALERDYVAFDSLFTGIQRASHFFFVGEFIQAFRHGDQATRARVLAAMGDSSDARLTTAARHAMFLLEETEPSLRLLELMLERTRPRSVRSWGYIHRAHLWLSGGQPARAARELPSALALDSARALLHEAWLFSLPFVNPSRAQMLALRERLNAFSLPAPSTRSEQELVLRGDHEIHAHIRLYLLGLLNAQLGDDTAAQRAAAALSGLDGTEPARQLAADLAHAVRAEVLRMRGRPREALAELERSRMQFDANRLNVAPFYAQVRERYVRAELLAQLGKRDDALGWYGSFDEHGPWGRVLLAPAALQQARIHDELGHAAEATRHYARFVNLWQHAEPQFRPLVDQAKQRLVTLQRLN